jgi:ankyrin repeat protein
LKRLAALVLILAATHAIAGPAEDRALIEAAFNLNLKGVQAALAKGADPNAVKVERSPLGYMISTPVLLSVVFAKPTKDTFSQANSNKDEWIRVDQIVDQTRTAIAKALFEAGATLGRLEDISRSILWSSSIRMGSLSLIQILVDHGASVTDKIYPEDLTPTELALREGQHKAYELLVSLGGSPIDDASSAQFALIASAGRSDLKGMEEAVKNGAQINNLIDDQTALSVALGGRIYFEVQVSAVRWLLDHGADPNVADNLDLPLHRFVWSSSFTMNELSKYKEEDLDSIEQAIKRSTGKDFDVRRVRALNEEVLISLLKAGAKVSSLDKYGWTPLHAAARFDNVMAAEILIREGAKIMQHDAKGKTPLDYAESAAMIKLLKANGATEQ